MVRRSAFQNDLLQNPYFSRPLAIISILCHCPQACADIKGSESTVESVECLAQWKEGSTYYFLGLISHDHVSAFDYEDRFRCFAYQEIFQVCSTLESVQDFLIKLDIEPLMPLLEISIFSLNNDLARLTKFMNNLVRDLKILSFKVIFG